MPTDLTSISSHKKQFQSPEMKVPVIFHASESLLPGEEVFGQLENLAKDERIFSHIAAMSDVHPKQGRKAPTGTVAASKNFLFPQINDTAPNCGMRFIRTDLDEQNFPPEKIDLVFQKLVKAVPTKKLSGNVIPFDLALEICKKGIFPLLEYLKSRSKNEIENCYWRGNFFQEDVSSRDVFNTIPKLFIQVARRRLGILGAAGNHFLDLMKITEIKDQPVADKFALKLGQYIFLIHTGSGLLGQYSSYMYTPKKRSISASG
jgi:tRNA-splicing ligase RtcB (3'-phosphate/5'-hydroxy nucleic acid ligase)